VILLVDFDNFAFPSIGSGILKASFYYKGKLISGRERRGDGEGPVPPLQ